MIPIGDLQHFQDDLFESEDDRTQKLIQSLDRKIEDAEENKNKVEELKNEAEIEAEKDEDFEKMKLHKEDIEKREKLALMTPNTPREENKQAAVSIDDIELGLMERHREALNSENSPSKEDHENALSLMKAKGNYCYTHFDFRRN